MLGAYSHGSLRTILQLRSKDLFVESESHSTVDCLQYLPNTVQEPITEAAIQASGISSISVNSLPRLGLLLRSTSSVKASNLFFISQATSWSRLRISLEMFEQLIQFYDVFPEFLPYVLVFGKKIRDAPETGMTSHMRLCTDQSSFYGYEICYNVKHFELHGRELKNPWSCRHAAFYQRHSFADHSSTWIIIQGPSKLNSYFEEVVSVRDRSSPAVQEHPLYLHVQFLNMLEQSWTSYLITLEAQRRKTSDKFLFLGSCEISVNLEDVNVIHDIQARVRTAVSIIEGTMSVVKSVIDLCSLLEDLAHQTRRSPLSPVLSGLVIANLKQLLNTFQNHMRIALKILQSSEDNKVMLLAIIDHRHNDLIRVHTSSIDALSAAASTDSRLRTKIADRALAETSFTRIATLITVFYLPFSLSTAFFSTNLITFNENGNLELRKSVWVFIIMTGMLLGCTAMTIWIWKRITQVSRRENTGP